MDLRWHSYRCAGRLEVVSWLVGFFDGTRDMLHHDHGKTKSIGTSGPVTSTISTAIVCNSTTRAQWGCMETRVSCVNSAVESYALCACVEPTLSPSEIGSRRNLSLFLVNVFFSDCMYVPTPGLLVRGFDGRWTFPVQTTATSH